MAEQIRAEHVIGNENAVKALERLVKGMDRLERSADRAAKTSSQGARIAEGSFESFNRELRESESRLKRLKVGSEQFRLQKQKVDELRRAVTRAKQQIGSMNDVTKKTSTGVIASAGRMATSFSGVHEAMRLVTSEFRKQEELAAKAAGQKKTFEQSLADVAFNLGGDSLEPAKQLIEANAGRLGVTREGLANLIGEAVSAGAKDVQEAFGVSEAALKLTAGDTTNASELVQASLDLASLSGSTNFRGAIGQVAQMQAFVRATDPSQFASNMGSAFAAGTSNRQNLAAVTTERVAEIGAVVSQVLKDREGSVTATKLEQAFAMLDKFQPEAQKELKDGTIGAVSKEVLQRFTSTRDFDEKLQLFRENEGLRKQFADTFREGKGKQGLVEFFAGTDRVLAMEARAREGITSIDEATLDYDKLAAAVGKQTRALLRGRQSDEFIKSVKTTGVEALRGEALVEFNKAVKNVDLPGLDAGMEVALAADRKLGELTTQNTAELYAKILRESLLGDQPFFRGALTEADRSIVENQVAVLERIAEDISAMRQEGTKVISDNPPQENPVPAGAIGGP